VCGSGTNDAELAAEVAAVVGKALQRGGRGARYSFVVAPWHRADCSPNLATNIWFRTPTRSNGRKRIVGIAASRRVEAM
jgi:hypothetical protein